jgi:endonuclease VIII-like 1
MPEISEVKLTAEFINHANQNRSIKDVQFLKTNKLKLVEELNIIGSTISAVSRGKELKLFFNQEPVVISLGMTGCFKNFKKRGYKNKHWKHGHIRFYMSDDTWFVWSDVRRFGKSVSTNWNPLRGPDIFNEEQLFKSNILENTNHPDFTKPAHIALMNQRWFNGIGNYLRAEILGKWNKNPFQPMKQLLNEPFLDHLIEQVHDSYRLGGGELYSWMNENKSSNNYDFHQWMKFYGKTVKTIDPQGRTFWYQKKWGKYLLK